MEWHELLDDIESRLADVERELRTGGPAVSPFVLPAGLGPLPAELRPRARRALRDTLAKLAEVEAARDLIADALRQGRIPSKASAAYIDTWI